MKFHADPTKCTKDIDILLQIIDHWSTTIFSNQKSIRELCNNDKIRNWEQVTSTLCTVCIDTAIVVTESECFCMSVPHHTLQIRLHLHKPYSFPSSPPLPVVI